MTRGALRDRVDPRGRKIPAPYPIARPAASCAVERGRPNAVFGSPERFVNGPPEPADLPQTVWINRSEQKKTAQDAPQSTIIPRVDLQAPLSSRSSEHSTATMIDLGATLMSSTAVSQCH